MLRIKIVTQSSKTWSELGQNQSLLIHITYSTILSFSENLMLMGPICNGFLSPGYSGNSENRTLAKKHV